MLSVSDKSDSVNERTQEISKLFKVCGKMSVNLLGKLAPGDDDDDDDDDD